MHSPPPVFWRRRTAAGRAGILMLRSILGLGLIVGLLDAIGPTGAFSVYLWTLGIAGVLITGMRALRLWRRGGVWECRIDGTAMTLMRPEAPVLVLDVGDVRQWIVRRVYNSTGNTRPIRDFQELMLRDGRCIRLDDYRMGRLRVLRRTLQKLNPAMEVVKVKEQAPADAAGVQIGYEQQ